MILNRKKASLILAVLTSVVFLTGCNISTKSENNPNIIYVLADDLGIGDISCYNETGKISTPHIDNMAENGMLTVEMGGSNVGNKKLAAVGVRPRVGHRQNSRT